MNTTAARPVKNYLKELDAELADLPRGRRREIVEEISEHIAEAQADGHAETEAEIRTLLDRLGDPAEIAAEARERFGVPMERPGRLETAALVLLLVGGFIFGVGWFVGLVLLWSSRVWTLGDKLVGTLIVPGGLAFPLFLFALLAAGIGGGTDRVCTGTTDPQTGQFSQSCTGGGGSHVLVWVSFACFLVAPLFTTAYLALRMRRRAELTAA